jgi:hypothetical protein
MQIKSVSTGTLIILCYKPKSSVADPDPSDPYVFGPPGSGSIFYLQAKVVRKNLDSYCFVTSFDFLSSKNYINIPSKSNKQ